MDFNSVLQEVGDFGLYQKLLCLFLVIPSASLCALVYFTQFFIILVPDHHCRLPGYEDFSVTNTSFIDDRSGNTTVHSEQCKIRYVTVSSDLPWVSNASSSPISNETGCLHGWTYNFNELYPTIATQMNWVCDKDQLPYESQTIFYIGTSVGCIVFGLIADRYGRRPSIVLSYFIAFVAGIATAYMNSFVAFNILRFFVGATIIPLSEDPYVLSLEYIGVRRRTLVIILWSMGYIIFSAICPWIAYALHDWRHLCVYTSIPLALIPLLGKFIPESASWLLTRGRKSESVKLLKTVARVNGRKYPEEFDVACCDNAAEEVNLNVNVLDLFRTPRLRRNTLVLAVTWFIVYCCYHTNTQNASNLGANIYDSFTYSALVEVPALVIILFGIDWLGRRWPVFGCSLIAGLAGLVIMILPRDATKTYLGFALVQRVTLATIYNIIMQYSAELLPTVLRGRGLAFLRFMGTLGLYLSPSIVYLSLQKPGLPLVVSGAMLLVISVMSLTLPETLHRHLPHTVLEGEDFGKDQRICDCPCFLLFKRKKEKEVVNE